MTRRPGVVLGIVGSMFIVAAVGAAVSGLSTQQARTAAPVTVDAASGNVEGTSMAFMRSDARQAHTFTAAGTGSATRTLAAKLGDVVSALDKSGADIGAQVNTAWADCSNNCTVLIPAGSYSYSTTINYPMTTNGRAKLVCDAGAALTYTGSGYALEALSTAGNASANVYIEGCRISGTSAGLAGIHFQAFNKATLIRVKLDSFSTGDGLRNEGANAIDLFSCDLFNNKNGMHNVGKQVLGVNYSANKVKMYGGQVLGNTTWGVFEDGSQSAVVGPNIGNEYVGVVFTANGTNGVTASGHVFMQRIDSASVLNSYFENPGSNTVPYAITVGDATFAARGVTLRNNWFGSIGSTSTIQNVNSINLLVDGNTESATIPNFITQGSASVNTIIGPNSFQGVTTPFVGTDSGNTIFWSTGSNVVNATGPTTRGMGFNQITGLDNDLIVRLRAAGANFLRFNTDVGTVGSIDNTGKINGGAFDSQSAAGLTIGGTNATSLTLGKAGITASVASNFTVTPTTTAGSITLAAGTGTATVYSGCRPICTDTTAAAAVRCAVAATTLTATGTATDVINYFCF